jgi:mono/diheme cytochrome c family protein
MNSFVSRLLAAVSVASLAWAAPALAGGHAQNIAEGKRLYMQDCASCHRASGAGGVHFGHAVSADLQAPGLEKTYHHNDKLIRRAILQAKDQNGERLDQPMPAWHGRLSTAQAKSIVAYLHTLHAGG